MLKKPKNHCTFYIVRHGETDWNAQGLIQGHVDIPLNASGKEQAIALGKQLHTVQFDLVFSSDLKRAMETAKLIVLDHMLAIETTQLLREKKFGAIEGKPVSELDTLDTLVESFSDQEKFTHRLSKDTENDAEVIQRCMTFLSKVAVASVGKTVLVVTHGGIIRTLLIHLGFFTYQNSRSNAIKNTAYIKLGSDGIDFLIQETQGIEKR